MSYKPTYERVADYDSTGKPIMYVNATHETGDPLPTDHIAQGSWSINLDDQSVVFFNGDTESWG